MTIWSKGILPGIFAALAAIVLTSGSARASLVCSDMDGDGTAETCVEIDDDGASFPGEDPPPVPDPGEGVPVE